MDRCGYLVVEANDHSFLKVPEHPYMYEGAHISFYLGKE